MNNISLYFRAIIYCFNVDKYESLFRHEYIVKLTRRH